MSEKDAGTAEMPDISEGTDGETLEDNEYGFAVMTVSELPRKDPLILYRPRNGAESYFS